MRQKPVFTTVLLLITLVISQEFGPFLSAQSTVPTPQELDQLLAPVALYPDSLLAQITTASTNPQEILDVDNWLQQNQGLTGTALTDAAQQQAFDPAFIALVTFPQVLEMMAQHIDDYAAIGQAFSADQAAVTASIQRLRAQAYASGALRSTPQQQVVVQQPSGQTVYVIQPASPQVVYVPQYDPAVVYVRPSSNAIVAASLISFGVGIGIGALLVDNRPWGWGGWGWNWGSRRVYYNRGYWGGWSNPYRPPRPWYRPRPIVWANRPGYRGDWRYRPPNYRPPYRPGNRPGYSRPPYGPNNRPGYNRPGSRPGGYRPPVQPNRPGVQPARPGTPNRPGVQPQRPGTPNRPSRPTSPGNTRPASPNRPGAERPAPRPQGRPSGQNRSQGQQRPTSPARPEARPQGEPRH
jgi:Protein of unknown function (DUF3300)